jgi:hypothetical protein
VRRCTFGFILLHGSAPERRGDDEGIDQARQWRACCWPKPEGRFGSTELVPLIELRTDNLHPMRISAEKRRATA